MLQAFIDRVNQDFYKSGPVNIVCLGDSVTQGCFQRGVVSPEDGYVRKLQKLLNVFYPRVVFNLINAGIGGTTAAYAAERLERDVLKFHPDLVLVMFGVNDTADIPLYRRSLETIFRRLLEEKIPCVFITEHMMNTWFDEENTYPGDREYAKVTMQLQNGGTMDTVFQEAREAAAKYGVPVCDIYKKWKQLAANGVDVTKLLINGINHPTPEMHTMLAHEVVNTLLF